MDKAIEYFSRSVTISPANARARRRLLDLGVDIEAPFDEALPSDDFMRRLAGRYQMPNGNVWEFRLVDRGLVLYADGSPNELVMQGPLSYTLPGLLFFEFGMNQETGAATMRVGTSATEWEATERLD